MGFPPSFKQERIFRILCKNPNGLNNQITGNLKLEKAIDIKDKLDADGLLFCKHRLNLNHRDNKNDFKQMFQCKVACRAIAANNVHQNIGWVQKGGPGMVLFGNSMGFITQTGKDPYGLGRWCWTLYGGSKGHNTRVVVAYNACKNSKKEIMDDISAATAVFYHEEERPNMPQQAFPTKPGSSFKEVVSRRG
jgi:hypothetical protein